MDTERIASCHALAQRHCNTGADDCRWYHGNWHLLKALGVVSTSAVHEAGIVELLESAIGDNAAPRFLVTGSADETLLRIVHKTCQALGAQARITALDICATPLAFMESYASSTQIQLATVRADILVFDAAERFDVILAHAFMGYFDDVHRQRLVGKWKELLSAKGRIVTIQRVRPLKSASVVRFSQRQASGFVATAIDAARQQGMSSGPELNRVKEAATQFSNRFCSHAIRSKAALEKLFVDAGMVFERLEYHTLGQLENLSGPSVPSRGEYAHIVARRP